MKTPRKVREIILPILLFFIMVLGCSGTLQSSAKLTLAEVPFGHGANPSKNKAPETHTISDYLPQKLGDLSLAKVIKNKEATDIINRMHGKKLEDCKNIIGYYGGRHSKNILYVSVYKNIKTAKTSLMRMAMKMAAGTPPFTPLTHSKMGAGVHFETEGMGLKHYFYRVDNILIWWQVEPERARATFHDLLEFDFTALNSRINKPL